MADVSVCVCVCVFACVLALFVRDNVICQTIAAHRRSIYPRREDR